MEMKGLRVTGLNHFNLVHDDIEAVADFYMRLGLTRGHRPGFGNTGIWLYIGDRPMIHLNKASEVGGCMPGAGSVHHLGLDVRGSLAEVEERLKALDITYVAFPYVVEGWFRALYFKGPCGEEIELVLLDEFVPRAGVPEREARCEAAALAGTPAGFVAADPERDARATLRDPSRSWGAALD